MKEQIFEVKGMTTDNCAKKVEDKVRGINGVTGVTADTTTGAVTVECSDSSNCYSTVKTAITEAGYQVVG